MVTGALLTMTFTYVFMIIHRQMTGETTVIDDKIFAFLGYAEIQRVPEAVKAEVIDLISPMVTATLAYILAFLAIRTRWRSAHPGTESGEPWRGYFLPAAIVTAVLYGILQFIGGVPSRYVCLLATLGCFLPSMVYAKNRKEWGQLAGFAFGGLFMGVFFFTEVDDAYPWAGNFDLVLLFYVGFFGASMATRDGRHVKIDAVRKKVPRRHLYLYNAVGTGVTVLFTLFLLVLAYHHLEEPVVKYLEFKTGGSDSYGHYIEGLELPEFMITLPIFLAFFVMTLRFSGRTLDDFGAWRRGEIPPAESPDPH